MPKTSTKIVYTFDEVLELIKQDLKIKNLKLSHLDIKESGDHDRGNYKRDLVSLTFKIDDDEK